VKLTPDDLNRINAEAAKITIQGDRPNGAESFELVATQRNGRRTTCAKIRPTPTAISY
jgi:hypothetical protein